MKKIVNSSVSYEYTCDQCWVVIKENPFVTFEYLNDIWLRLFQVETKAKTRHLEFWKEEIDLCSDDCVKCFVEKEARNFIEEIKASNRKDTARVRLG